MFVSKELLQDLKTNPTMTADPQDKRLVELYSLINKIDGLLCLGVNLDHYEYRDEDGNVTEFEICADMGLICTREEFSSLQSIYEELGNCVSDAFALTMQIFKASKISSSRDGAVGMCYDKPIDLFKMRYVMSAPTVKEVESLLLDYINNYVFVINGLNKFD